MRSSRAYDHLHNNQPSVLHDVLVGPLKPMLARARYKDDETKHDAYPPGENKKPII